MDCRLQSLTMAISLPIREGDANALMSQSGLSYLVAFCAEIGHGDRDNPTQLHAHNATNSGEQQVNTTNWL
ncbi:hypothetical protein [Chamaesiphon sp.]|uniref:hypothetical protein n=1 Tax=Chamaesiphon sp. TaxID=2814140 RepID=UPI0035942924